MVDDEPIDDGALNRERFGFRIDGSMLDVTVSNDTSLFTEISEAVLKHLLERGKISRDVQLELATAMEEALANAVIHGNLELPSDARAEPEEFHRLIEERRRQLPYSSRQAHLQVRLASESVELRIRDEGPGFDPNNLPQPPVDASGMAPWGSGLKIIRAFMDEVQHNPQGNEIQMIKRLPNAAENTAG